MSTTTKKVWTEEELENKIVGVKPMSPAEEQKVYDMLIESRIQMILHYTFFGYLSMNLEFKCDYSIQTAATDAENFYYNPYFIKALSTSERSWILVHEVMHAALSHMFRRGNRDPQKWNYAADYCIHSLMMQFLRDNRTSARHREILTMPKNCLYNSQFDDMTTEQIYDILPTNYKQTATFGNSSSKSSSSSSSSKKNNNGNDSSSTNGQGDEEENDQSTTGTPLDDHKYWNKPNTQQDSSLKQDRWKNRLVSASMEVAKKAGSLPGLLQQLIVHFSKPQLPWEVILNQFLEDIITDYSFCPTDSRYTEEEFGDIKMPGFNDPENVVKNVIFYVDTSGSMSQKDIDAVFSEVSGACDRFKHLYGWFGTFDADATDLVEFEDAQSFHLAVNKHQAARGGTSYRPLLKKIWEKFEPDEVNAIIIMTDLYCDIPDVKEFNTCEDKVIWVVTTTNTSEPSIGRTLRIKTDNPFD